MGAFRKKPVVIEAVDTHQMLIYAKSDWRALPEWLREAYEQGNIVFRMDAIDIKTLEGWMLANPSDKLIRGVKGEIYPCKPDIFEATYEAA